MFSHLFWVLGIYHPLSHTHSFRAWHKVGFFANHSISATNSLASSVFIFQDTLAINAAIHSIRRGEKVMFGRGE